MIIVEFTGKTSKITFLGLVLLKITEFLHVAFNSIEQTLSLPALVGSLSFFFLKKTYAKNLNPVFSGGIL